MPRLDQYHYYVVNALEAAGWTISKKQFSLEIGERDVFPDILAWKDPTQRVIVEVKVLKERESLVHQMTGIIGQYLLYRLAIEENNGNETLYLGLIFEDYQTMFKNPLGEIVKRKLGIKLIVVDVFTEEIVTWLE